MFLWSASLDEPGVEADVPDVWSVEQPRQKALQAESIAAMGARAILPLQTNKSYINQNQRQIQDFIWWVHTYFCGWPLGGGRYKGINSGVECNFGKDMSLYSFT